MSSPFLVPTPTSRARLSFQTGVSLSLNHRVAIGKLQAKRMAKGQGKPSLKEIVIEALEMLLKAEWVQ